MTIFTWTLHAQTPSQSIAFEERVHDFGKILEKNGKASHAFQFHNNGKTPVVINDVYSGCGCIGKLISNTAVQPGGKGKVMITFDPAYKSGFFSKEIMVFSNAGQNYNRIWVQGTVIPFEHPIEEDYPYNFGEGLYLRLKVMAFGYLKAGETKQVELHYANSTNKEIVLNFVVEAHKGDLKFQNPGKIGPKAKGVVEFSFTMPNTGNEDAVFNVHPYINNKKLNETLEVKALNANKHKQMKSSE